MVGFDDHNANGIRDISEPGISQVKVSILYRNATSQEAATDDTGLAQLDRSWDFCLSSFIEELDPPPQFGYVIDPYKVSVLSPDGYLPPGMIQSGPYWVSLGVSQNVVYVPLRKAG